MQLQIIVRFTYHNDVANQTSCYFGSTTAKRVSLAAGLRMTGMARRHDDGGVVPRVLPYVPFVFP